MKEKVSLVRCEDYSKENVEDALRESLNLISGIKRFVKRGDKVLLKVNLLMPRRPEAGITTHPAVMRILAKMVKERGAEVMIGDSSMWMTSKALKLCGVEEVARELGVKAVNLDTFRPRKVKIRGGKVLKEVYIPSLALDVDVLVSVPKLKAHELTSLTGAVKNLLGLIPGRLKTEVHKTAPDPESFSEALLDIYSVVKPSFAVMDGVISVEGSAGVGGTRKVGVILASDNLLALDTVAGAIIGYKPEDLPVNKMAKKRGLKGISLKEIEVLGEEISEVAEPRFRKPSRLIRLLGSFPVLNPFLTNDYKPLLNRKECVRCEVCVEHCPVGAIKADDEGYPEFDYDKCIQCFCCREGCQAGAIELQESLLAKMISRIMAG